MKKKKKRKRKRKKKKENENKNKKTGSGPSNSNLLTCGFSWGDINKRLFTPNRTSTTEPRDNSSESSFLPGACLRGYSREWRWLQAKLESPTPAPTTEDSVPSSVSLPPYTFSTTSKDGQAARAELYRAGARGGVRRRKEGVGGILGEGLMTLLWGNINRPDLVRVSWWSDEDSDGYAMLERPTAWRSCYRLGNIVQLPYASIFSSLEQGETLTVVNRNPHLNWLK